MSTPLIIYVRQSKTDGKEDRRNLSPSQQVARARKFAEDNGYAVGEVIEDLDVSGGVHPRDRPGMARALEEIRAGRAGGLVAFSLDRFSRDPSHGDDLVREVTSHGGVLIAPDMPEDIDSPTGEFTFGMLLQVARLYRRTAGARFKLSVEEAIRRGIPIGRVPFGYRRVSESTGNPDDRHLEIHPEHAETVRELYRRRIAGEGFGVLCDWMMEATGRDWSRAGVSDMVGNTLYRDGRVRSGEFVSPIECGQIVDAATWQAAQRPQVVVDGRTVKSQGPAGRPKWLLSGLLVCAGCGNNLHPWGGAKADRHSRRGGRRYRCAKRACNARASILAEPLEELVVERAFDANMAMLSQSAEAPDLAPLEEGLADAERRFTYVQSPEGIDALGDAWASTAKAYRESRDAAARALGEARSAAGIGTGDGRQVSLAAVWDDLDREQQRYALQHTFERVIVSKVPPRTEPELEFVISTRPWRLEYEPVEIDWLQAV